jgi:hypothetical protein
VSVDLAVFKNTPVTEKADSQIRVEMFHVSNRVNLSEPSMNAGCSSLWTIGSRIGAGDGTPGIGAGEPFNLQLALKVQILF